MNEEKPMFKLTVKIAAHILLFWVPAYIVAVIAAIYSVASLVDDVKNYVWILVLLSLILGCCLALGFWTFEKLNPIIESSDVSKKAKVMARGALYFIPWAMFLVTLSLPAALSQF